MKFTKLFAASFAALAMFSCSKETTDNAPMVSPTDAVITMQVGGGVTTYGTVANETFIGNVQAGLYASDGSLIPPKSVSYASGKVSIVVDAKNIPQDGEAQLAVFANVEGMTEVPATLVEAQGLKTSQTLDYEVKKGLPASSIVSITGIASGANVTQSTGKLKRAVARFWVGTPASRDDIKGYTVEIVNTSEGVTISTGVEDGAKNKSYEYKIPDTVPAEQLQVTTNGVTVTQESAFYTYPTTSGAVINVYNADHDLVATTTLTSGVGFNKNYQISITVGQDGAIDGTDVEVGDFEEADEIEIVVKGSILKTKFPANDANVELNANGELILPGTGMAGVDALKVSDFVVNTDYTIENVSFTAASTRTASSYTVSSNFDSATGLFNLTMPANYSGVSVNVGSLAFNVVKKADSSVFKTVSYPVILTSSTTVPAGMFVDFYGTEFARLPFSVSLSQTVANYNTVNAEAGATWEDKCTAYRIAHPSALANYQNVFWTRTQPVGLKEIIPAGFSIANIRDLNKLVGSTRADSIRVTPSIEGQISGFKPISDAGAIEQGTVISLGTPGVNEVEATVKQFTPKIHVYCDLYRVFVNKATNEMFVYYGFINSGGAYWGRIMCYDQTNTTLGTLAMIGGFNGQVLAAALLGQYFLSNQDGNVILVKDKNANVIWK